jgi:hypothetical protein
LLKTLQKLVAARWPVPFFNTPLTALAIGSLTQTAPGRSGSHYLWNFFFRSARACAKSAYKSSAAAGSTVVEVVELEDVDELPEVAGVVAPLDVVDGVFVTRIVGDVAVLVLFVSLEEVSVALRASPSAADEANTADRAAEANALM